MRQTIVLAVSAVVVWGVGQYILLPRLDSFSEGALSARFEKTDLSGREVLMKGDMLLFLQHPLLGVGVGLAKSARRSVVDYVGHAHTEFTRLLSEHGLLGAGALVALVVMAAGAISRQKCVSSRAVSASLVAFAFVFMTGSAMRLAVPCFLLSFARVRVRSAIPEGGGTRGREGRSRGLGPPGCGGSRQELRRMKSWAGR
jgi:O-antigen ligase